MQTESCIDILIIKSTSKPTKSLTYLRLIVSTYFSFQPSPVPLVTTYLSPISIKLVFQEGYLNRLTHVLFCDDFSSFSLSLSRSICILGIKTSFIVISEYVMLKGPNKLQPVSIYPLKDIWAILSWVL